MNGDNYDLCKILRKTCLTLWNIEMDHYIKETTYAYKLIKVLFLF